jgi:nucleoid DNA-binding protein
MPDQKPLTKTQLLGAVADESGLTKQQVQAAFDAFSNQVRQSIGPSGAGSITFPGLFKIVKVEKPAREAKTGVPNPFKPGETMDVAAKPASNAVKVRPLKGLKDMV